MRGPWLTRVLRGTVATGIAVSVVSGVLLSLPEPARADASAVTVNGTGPFSDLSVTVEKTTDLLNEVVHITWRGGQQTQGQGNFLQIMQCWGSVDSDGEPLPPTREQCQFGGLYNQLGGWASTRQAFYGPGLVDTAETIVDDGSGLPQYVPFEPVNGDAPATGNTNRFFDENTTNEVARGLTFADGSGEAYFQMQTAREAPGLGCGTEIDDVTTVEVEKARFQCYLVIVPRGDRELPGIDASSSSGVSSSPLTVTNWARRMVVPLEFQNLTSTCDIAIAQTPTFGSELMTDAMRSWVSGLCRDTPQVFGFSQVPDDLARTTLMSAPAGEGAMALIGSAIPAAQTGSAPLVYAPVSISAVGVGFVIERQSLYRAPQEVRALDGKRLTDIKLTPRLVAKILTQSYLGGTVSADPANSQKVILASGEDVGPLIPGALFADPEFLRLNPDLVPLAANYSSAITPYIPADSTKLLWQWVLADKDARNFLAGKPNYDSPWFNDCGRSSAPKRCIDPATIDCTKYLKDSRGNVGCPTYVNPAYRGLAAGSAPNSFPKLVTACFTYETQPPLCNFDLFPYAGGMTEAALAVTRGDTLARTRFNGIGYSKGALQAPGSLNVMAVTDTPSAARYGLSMARLLNGAGEFVAPTPEAMATAVAAMKTDSAGLLQPNPTTKATGAYPLTTVLYAAVNRATLSAESRRAYSDLLTYAGTLGQRQGTQPGQLPEGYQPLPVELRRKTTAAAALVAAALPVASPTPTPTLTPSPSQTPTPSQQPTSDPAPSYDPGTDSGNGTGGGSTETASPTDSSSGSSSPVSSSPAPSSSSAPTPSPTTTPVSVGPVTPLLTAGFSGHGPLVTLILGMAAALSAAALLGLSGRGA